MDKWNLVTVNTHTHTHTHTHKNGIQRADGLLLEMSIYITNTDAKSRQRRGGWEQCSGGLCIGSDLMI